MRPDTIVDVLLALDPLCDLPRTGWILRGIASPESIAAHSHGVAVVAMMLVDALRESGEAVDGERTLRMALLHDAPEARTGDVPMPNKTPEMRRALEQLEAVLAREMLPPDLAALWEEAERGETIEARIVKASDKIQMMIKALAYERHGRGRLDEFWDNPGNFRDMGLPFARAVFEAIAERAGRTLPS